MNERINNLVDKTAVIIPGVYTIEYESGKKGVEFNEEALNKFAELIIRECVEKCLTDWYGDSLDDICKQMKQHFGVE